MALDLNSFFNDLKSSQLQTVDNKSLENMSEDEKEEFYNSNDYRQYSANGLNTVQSLNYEGKNVQEIFGLSGNTNRFSYNCFEFLETDHLDYLDIVDFSPEMQATIAEGESLLPTFKYLHEDIFMSLYQFNAQVLPPEKMHIQSYMNRNILNQLINTPVYIALRKTCRCDMFNAGIGAEIIGKQAIEILKQELAKIKDFQKKKEALEKLVEQEEKMDCLSEELDEMEELIEEMQMRGNDSGEEYDELIEKYNENKLSLQEARALAEAMAEDCEELVETTDEMVSNMVIDMNDSITNATTEIAETSAYVQAWGLGEGSDIKVPFGIKRSVLERIRNSEQLKEFTDLIGKYKECAITEQKKKSRNSAIEIKSVKVNNKIEDALPSEKLGFCNDVLKKDIYRKISEGQLMSYDKESQKQKNKGPIIVCVDMSGSMHGNKEMWAKALSVGILEIAQMQKREFAIIPYDSYVRDITVIHKDEINPEKIIGIAEMNATGGTDFQYPLEEASKLIENSTFKEADIVFITDGDCSIRDDFRRKFKQLKEDKDFRTLGVLVDYGGHNTRSTLDDFCDSVSYISKIADAKNADSDVNKMIFGTL